MRSEMKADAMKELEAIEKEIEEVMTRVRCCCHIRKQKNQSNAKNKKKYGNHYANLRRQFKMTFFISFKDEEIVLHSLFA